MTNIDSSLRRPILPQVIGDQVPDSKQLLDEIPQVIMSPGVVRPVFKFLDGLGLTDAFGNVYDGYAGAGGSSIVWTHLADLEIPDFISGIIEAPQNTSYEIVISLPYSIKIVDTHFSSVSGPGTINFPSGTRLAHTSLSISVTGSTPDSEFFSFQIDFER